MRSWTRIGALVVCAAALSAGCGGGNGTTTGSGDSGPEVDGTVPDGASPSGEASTDGSTADATASGEGGTGVDAGGTADASGSADGAVDSGAPGPDSGATGAEAGADSGSTGTDGGSDSGAGADSGGGEAGILDFGQSCNGTPTILTGTVFAPNGVDPIPNVRVYAAVQINPYPASYCDKCAAPIDPAYASATTAANGTFSLNLDTVPASPTITFTIQIGRFRKHTTLNVTACTTTSLPAPASGSTPAQLVGTPNVLPGSSAAGDIPRIAVSTGNVDHLDQVLTTLGITEWDCYEGRDVTSNPSCTPLGGKNIAQVLYDGTATGISQYHMAFLSCAPDAYAYFMAHPPTGVTSAEYQQGITNNTQTWVAAGGRVFVTDTSYDYIAQAFPAAITWAGDAGSPQPIDGANLGCAPAGTGATSAHAVLYPTTIDDPTLAAWLSVVNILPTPTPTPAIAQIQGYYQPWSQMSSLASGTTLVADGAMPVDPSYATDMCNAPTMKDVPLTATFDVPSCGRVEFSSYHTYTGTGASATAANEKIMEYEIFNAAVCHF
jgi:hypothetical protein